jgi:phospholipase/carboxylesterase
MSWRAVFCLLFISVFAQAQHINTPLSYSVEAPKKITSKTPVLVLLHGYGSNEADLLSLKQHLPHRFLFFSLRAPKRIERGGFCWYQMDFMPDKTFRYHWNDIVESRKLIMDFVRSACQAYKADSEAVYLLGFSQGAMVSVDVALHAPSKIKGVMALSGRLIAEETSQKLDDDSLPALNFFVAHGSKDEVIPYREFTKLGEWLGAVKKTKVTMKSYDMGHSISSEELRDITAWLGP